MLPDRRPDLAGMLVNRAGRPVRFASWFNRTSGNYRVYKDINCVNFLFTAQAGARASQSGFNDQASSICRGTGCP